MYTQLLYYFLSTYKSYNTLIINISIQSYYWELHKIYQLCNMSCNMKIIIVILVNYLGIYKRFYVFKR